MRAICSVLLLSFALVPLTAQVRLADESDRAAFRRWFVLLADTQFEQRAPEVTDCAALVRFAFREALRRHDAAWARRVGLRFLPQYPDVRSAPEVTAEGWPLFRVRATGTAPPAAGPSTSAGPSSVPQDPAGRASPVYGEFADARTLIDLNSRPRGRDVRAAQPGDLLYFRQPTQSEPDHLMVFVGRSLFDPGADDWLVYHTGPADVGPGEVRKVRLADLLRHPAPRWRPVATNPAFIGVFRLALL